MAKEKLNILESTCVPLPLENIDTDQIIPARFLSATSREGFGENLSATGDTGKMVHPNPDLSLIIRHGPGKYLSQERTSGVAPAGNMPSGQFMTMVSGL